MELTGTQGRCSNEPVVAEIACLRVDASTQFILQKWRVLLLRRILGRYLFILFSFLKSQSLRSSQFSTVISAATIVLDFFARSYGGLNGSTQH